MIAGERQLRADRLRDLLDLNLALIQVLLVSLVGVGQVGVGTEEDDEKKS